MAGPSAALCDAIHATIIDKVFVNGFAPTDPIDATTASAAWESNNEYEYNYLYVGISFVSSIKHAPDMTRWRLPLSLLSLS